MSRSKIIVTLSVVSALNLIALAANLCLPARAAGGGSNYQDLMRDNDFVRAVKSIVESCTVNLDIDRVKCQ
jgi:hypothetical protein